MDETADAGAGKPADAAGVPDGPTGTAPDGAVKAADAAPQSGECPENMTRVLGACMDLYEAPGVPGALPLVMYTFDESEAWCQAQSQCATCSTLPGCGQGYSPIESWTGPGQNWYACKKR